MSTLVVFSQALKLLDKVIDLSLHLQEKIVNSEVTSTLQLEEYFRYIFDFDEYPALKIHLRHMKTNIEPKIPPQL